MPIGYCKLHFALAAFGARNFLLRNAAALRHERKPIFGAVGSAEKHPCQPGDKHPCSPGGICFQVDEALPELGP
jgi:hypothetical protein